MVTPNEIARRLGITGLQFRNWLRAKKAEGHPLLRGHVKHSRYAFSEEEAEQLVREYREDRDHGQPKAHRSSPRVDSARKSAPALSDEPGHRIESEWMGARVTTLADLLRPDLLAVVVGINPAPPSVAAGHYWQGRTGRTLWARLRAVGLLPHELAGYEDDAAFAAGVGFTDVVKRPTVSAADVSEEELAHGRRVLEAKLEELDVPLVIFAFKKPAVTLFGPFHGNGFLGSRRLGTAEVFVMPGPYEKAATAGDTLAGLRRWVEARC